MGVVSFFFGLVVEFLFEGGGDETDDDESNDEGKGVAC